MEKRNRPIRGAAAGGGFVWALVVCLCSLASANSGAVTILSPQNASVVDGSVPLTMSASSDVVLLKVSIDGKHFTSVTPNTSVIWNTQSVHDGHHRVTVRAFMPKPVEQRTLALNTVSDSATSSTRLKAVGAASSR